MSTTTSINIPQILVVLLIGGVLIRYFFFSSSSSSTAGNFPGGRNSNSGAAGRPRHQADPRHVEQIAAMFPQVSRRDIMWDLQRNGGSVAATSERILSGRLETPPRSFQPPSLASSTSNGSTPGQPSTSSTSIFISTPKQEDIDLIKRYNLQHKLASASSQSLSSPSVAEGEGAEKRKEGWLPSKSERQALLQRRREEMILNARRKLEEEDRKGV
ncbi:MAG: hypothetical protein MMC33_006864 [Icmadophila ericetorum]|nr:hypothetical protein [Icmadophila ericetorum]